MSSDIAWPPVSPHAALMSSPSGRKKYDTYKSGTSPMKRSATTPSLVDRLRAARTNNDFRSEGGSAEDEEEDEDEETLRLQLAAIEAKLKLKKLQQSKARAATPARDLDRPESAHQPSASQVEVKASPSKRIQAPPAKSPTRVLLGIDKGVRGADVSLRRANTTNNGHRSRGTNSSLPGNDNDRPHSRSSAFNSARSATSSRSTLRSEPRKTFSERMTEVRQRETTIEQRRATIMQNRSRGFALDQTEIDQYRSAAEERRKQEASKSPTRQYFEYSRNEVLQATSEANAGSRQLKKSRTMPNLRTSPSRDNTQPDIHAGDAALYEGFSGLHLSSRILPHSFLKRTLPTEQYTILRVPDLLKVVKSPAYELPESVCDFVVFAVIASKSSPMDHKTPNSDSGTVGTKDWERQWEDGSRNHRRFMALTLTDLQWTIDLYLFSTALPRYHRLTPGTVVAILNPCILPPKSGKADTGAFSLSLADDSDTILEIGTARDLGYCKTLKKDGKECGSWVNAAKTEICEWHLNAEISRTKAKRMGVNTGTNGFGEWKNRPKTRDENGGKGAMLKRDGRRYDRTTESHYYVASTGPKSSGHTYRAGFGPHLLDNDDPFLPGQDGQLSRPSDRDSRVRKRLAALAKEREIAEKLGSREHGGFGFESAGAEYMRQKARAKDDDPAREKRNTKTVAVGETDTRRSGPISGSILTSTNTTTNENRKRTAADVRLSPVKKTRFVTEKGIREAGRDSLGAVGDQSPGIGVGVESESEDELEIV
ncbi:putative DNA replication protein [Fonsecaea pedrosoi]|nr:putative DNA replication protein [Fonsecaea pedrosoi]